MQAVSRSVPAAQQPSGFSLFTVTVRGRTSAGTLTSFRGEVLAPTAAQARRIGRRIAADFCGIFAESAKAVRS